MNTQSIGWTTIEQSKKLLEAGLKPNTADMHIINQNYKNHGCYDTALGYSKWDAIHIDGYLPCWSLGRLIELMQDFNYNMNHNLAGDLYVFGTLEPKYYVTINCKSPIEACVEFILWLLEQKYI